MMHTFCRCPAEHHIELREAEDEPVRLVDKNDVDVVAEFIRQSCRELEPTEPGTQHEDPHAAETNSAAQDGPELGNAGDHFGTELGQLRVTESAVECLQSQSIGKAATVSR